MDVVALIGRLRDERWHTRSARRLHRDERRAHRPPWLPVRALASTSDFVGPRRKSRHGAQGLRDADLTASALELQNALALQGSVRV